ncbi:hypothetical protein ACG7TL_004005 [Trametes sanguinea]
MSPLHLAKTTNPSCSAVYAAMRDTIPSDTSCDESDEDESMPQCDPCLQPPPEGDAHLGEEYEVQPEVPVPFAGDFFGRGEDYSPADFGLYDEDGDVNMRDEDILGNDRTHDVGGSSDSDSSSSDSDDDEFEESAGGWEPPLQRTSSPSQAADDDVEEALSTDEHGPPLSDPSTRQEAEEHLRQVASIEKFPSPMAGAPVDQSSGTNIYEDYIEAVAGEQNPYAPFPSFMNWAIARWAKLRGPGSTALTELLGIPGLPEALKLSFKTTNELNKIIDTGLPGRPRFRREEIVVADEAFDVYFRDIIECIRALFGDAEFVQHLVFAPERHYADKDKTVRLYYDMHTCKWWWVTQNELERRKPGATIIPVIISSDKTQVTLFRGKTAYPVYLTIGNIPKELRRKPSQRAQVLLAYLPTSRLEHITSKAARRRTLANLFHACMRRVLEPLKAAGVNGILMQSGDGKVRRAHPLFAAFVGDYPEQVLVTGTKGCPTCPVPEEEFGDSLVPGQQLSNEPRDLAAAIEAFSAIEESPHAFFKACRDARLKPIYKPFWTELPYVDIFLSIPPDVLHQLYQGIVKHLLSWIKQAFGTTEIDARCRRMPPNHNARHFHKGISSLSRLTGGEHSDICRILLGLIIDLPLPDGRSPARLVRAVRGMLDFLYLAQYPVHTKKTLGLMNDAMHLFHHNKTIFIDLGIRAHFNFPKLHVATSHYVSAILRLGTTDNFNTEYTERLHIDLAKLAYRSTNRKDEFMQMTIWLERREKVLQHDRYVAWRLKGKPTLSTLNPIKPPPPEHHIKMSRHPSVKAVALGALIDDYRAPYFRDALTRYLVHLIHPTLSRAQVERFAMDFALPMRSVPVYHKIRFWIGDTDHFSASSSLYDVAHAHPARTNKRGALVPSRFDTVIVKEGSGGFSGVDGAVFFTYIWQPSSSTDICYSPGYRVCQVKVVFALPRRTVDLLFPGDGEKPSQYLAYVEWFTPFRTEPEPNHGLYKVSRVLENGLRVASIVPLSHIRRSVHLFPKFGASVPRNWTSSNVLDECSIFYLNSFLDRHCYRQSEALQTPRARLLPPPLHRSSPLSPNLPGLRDILNAFHPSTIVLSYHPDLSPNVGCLPQASKTPIRVAEMDARTRLWVAEAEERVRTMEARTAGEIQQEREQSAMDRARTEALAKEAQAEVEARLHAAMEEADTYLDHARHVIAAQTPTEDDRELTGRLRKQLEQAINSANRLREQTASLRKQNKALRARVDRASAQKERAVNKALAEAASSTERPSLVLKEGGVVPDATRSLVRDMIELGLKVDQVKGAMHAVTCAVGAEVEGDISSRSVRRIVLEGLVASRVQIGMESKAAKGITVSCDGTTNRNINYDSRYLYLNDGDIHERRFLGIDSAPNHTSNTQLQGWQSLTKTIFNTYNASPQGQKDPIDARAFLQKVHGMLTDHAEDQKRLKKLFAEWKRCADRELRGERAMQEIAPLDLLPILAEEAAAAVERAGGADAWSQLEPDQLEVKNLHIRERIIGRLGEAAYEDLPETDKELADLFVHAGCCMHKELNAVKGGNTRLMAFWANNGVQAPILLMNRDNDAAARTGSATTKAQAEGRSCGGGVKLAELAGALFRHKDDKKGQQDATRFFFEATLGFQFSFPDTSNTRYQSYCEAAGELLVHLPHYRDFLDIVRDKKDSGRFNHLEHNVWQGLQDLPTLTELCVLALYGQAISHPYIREARGPQDGLTNHLSLGPLHDRVKAHIARLIADPELLLAPDASYETGSLDGRLWERPEVIISVHQLMSKLPHLRNALVEFLKGSLETWGRFTAEFAPGGTIAKLTESLRQLAWMPSTNDGNEGALGAFRVGARNAPNMSLSQHNAREMYKLNDTSTYIATSATPAEHCFYRKEARRIDSSGLEKMRRADVAAESERVAKRRKGEREVRAAKKAARREKLESVQVITDLLRLTMERTMVKLLDEQLNWHRMFIDVGPKEEKNIPMKKLLPTKELKLKALVAAVERYLSVPRPDIGLTVSSMDDVVEDDGYSSEEGLEG